MAGLASVQLVSKKKISGKKKKVYFGRGNKRIGKYKLLSSRRSTGQRDVGDAGTGGGEQTGYMHVCGMEKTRQEKGKALEK